MINRDAFLLSFSLGFVIMKSVREDLKDPAASLRKLCAANSSVLLLPYG
jgi:hypothetical protein